MKKKILIIGIIIIIFLCIIGLATSIYHNAIVKNNMEFEIATKVAYANWAENDGGLGRDKNCLNSNKFIFSDAPRYPVFKFETKKELDEFKNNYMFQRVAVLLDMKLVKLRRMMTL